MTTHLTPDELSEIDLRRQLETERRLMLDERTRADVAEKRAAQLERDLDDANTTIAAQSLALDVLREELARATEGARDAHIREAVALSKSSPADALGVRVERLERRVAKLEGGDK